MSLKIIIAYEKDENNKKCTNNYNCDENNKKCTNNKDITYCNLCLLGC